jgi:hypothetical protein
MEAGAQEAGVEGELGGLREACDDRRACGVTLERRAKCPDERGIGVPVDVLGRVERGKAPYFNRSLIFERNPPSPEAPPLPPATPANAAAKSSAVS